MDQAGQLRGWHEADGHERFSVALARLVESIEGACGRRLDAWPDTVGIGVYAGIDYIIEAPGPARLLFGVSSESPFGMPFRRLVRRLSGLLEEAVPFEARPSPETAAAAVSGVGLLVGNQVRVGQADRLASLGPELHLLVLLPYLGFAEAKHHVGSFPGHSCS
jgi:hypothetical protein